MSKIILAIFSLLMTFFIFTLNSTSVYALEKCIMGTDPSPLTNETPKAKFIVSVANLGGADAFNDWKIEFKCGAPNKKCGPGESCPVVKNKPDKIYTEIENSAFLVSQCIFDAGGHTLIVKGIRSDGAEVDQCETSYGVQDAKTLCKLSITPETGITSKTTLSVSGTNLVSGGQFALFVDKERITGNPIDPGFVTTPTFSGIQIPGKYMTPGPHKVELRPYKEFNLPGYELPIIGGLPIVGELPVIGKSGGHQYGNAVCSLGFRVGTDTNPGGVSAPGPGGVVGWIPGIPALASPCDKNPDNPGISTAIGCIHTNPVAFVKDMLKFVVGIAGGLAFLMMLLGAFQMITSAGNPDTLNAGRDRFANAIIGLLFVIFAVLLLQIIGVDILGILKK